MLFLVGRIKQNGQISADEATPLICSSSVCVARLRTTVEQYARRRSSDTFPNDGDRHVAGDSSWGNL